MKKRILNLNHLLNDKFGRFTDWRCCQKDIEIQTNVLQSDVAEVWIN